jgi:mRNA interferase RelE/StbE
MDKVADGPLKAKVAHVVSQVIQADSLSEIKNLKKLKGFKTAYRIKIGDFRTGLVFEDNTVFFAAIANRKDIYKRFP